MDDEVKKEHGGETTWRQSSLTLYEKKVEAGKQSTCTLCQKKVKGGMNLMNKHMKTHTGERKHKCPECGKAFLLLTNMNRHIRTHSGEKLHICKECDKPFSRTDELTKHLKNHSVKEPIKCQICFYVCIDQYSFKEHTLVHKKDGSRKCAECDKSFTNASSLNAHIFGFHGSKKAVICELCPYSFTTLTNLKEHMEKHNPNDRPIKLVKCKHCPFTYYCKTQPDLPIDILIHAEG